MLGRLIKEHEEFREMAQLRLDRIIALEQALMARVPIDELKALWDSYDGLETSDPVISGEMVHAELGRRGLQDYCSV